MFSHTRLNNVFLVFSFLAFGQTNGFSQRMVEVKYEQDAKGGFVFSCINYAYCNYILDLGFTVFNNVKSDHSLPFHAEVKPGYNKLFTITAIDPQLPTQIKYNSAFQKGCISPVVNPDFTYLLPISPGKSAQFYEMSPDKKADSANWYVVRLRMKAGDTLYAARKGVINEIQDQDGANDAGQTSVQAENFIEIAQPDCSFARYGILKKNGALVKPGQSVKAGQPIGLVGGDAFGRGSDLRFSVYYYRQEEDVSHQNPGRHYIITQIWTKNNGKSKLKNGVVYTSEFPPAVLNQESPVPITKKKKKS
jgi:murein DD-endopeptidase MepM/ murein hydrolase activator NlpD